MSLSKRLYLQLSTNTIIKTHWCREKTAFILQTAYSHTFVRMKTCGLQIIFHWNMFIRVQLTICRHWFWLWLDAEKATWGINNLPDWWLHIYASVTERQLCNDSNIWKGLFIDIEHEGLDNKITLSNIYVPLKNKDSNTVLSKFNEEIRWTFTQLSQERSNFIVAGDTTIDLSKINDRIEFHEYFDIFIKTDCFPKSLLRHAIFKQKYCIFDRPYILQIHR